MAGRPTNKERAAKKAAQKLKEKVENTSNIEDVEEIKEEKILDDIKVDKTDVAQDFNPLDEAVDEKSYTGANIEVKGELPSEIPEPELQKTIIEFDDKGRLIDNENDESEQQETPPPSDDSFDFKQPDEQPTATTDVVNEPPQEEKKSLKTMFSTDGEPDGEKKSRQLVKIIVKGYKWLFEQGYNFLELSDEKIKKQALNGKIEYEVLFVEMPLNESGTQTVTIYEFIEDYNKNLKTATTVDAEFLEEVEEVLTRIFVARGIGMSDEVYLAILVGSDMANRAVSIFSLKYSVSSIMKYATTMIREQRDTVEKNKARKQQEEKITEVEDEYSDEERDMIQAMRAEKMNAAKKKAKAKKAKKEVADIEFKED